MQESFSGDIQGDGVVEFLQAGRADGSASFAGLERVTGKLAGREGTFVLQDTGIVDGSIVSGDWFVVPGSGTGQLAGLRGDGGFRAASVRAPRSTWTTGSNDRRYPPDRPGSLGRASDAVVLREQRARIRQDQYSGSAAADGMVL